MKDTKDAVRVAIARHLGANWWLFDSGWTRLSFRDLSKVGGFQLVDKPKDPAKIMFSETVPDYTSDLNAMHEAEKTLNPERYWQFVARLIELAQTEFTEAYADHFQLLHANAWHRAQAFIQALNLEIKP